MADPKGLYYGQGNAGLATVLPDSNPAAMAQAIEDQKMKKAAFSQQKQEAANKRKAEAMKLFGDVNQPTAIYQPQFQKKMSEGMEEVLTAYKNGDPDLAEEIITRKVLEMNGFSKAANEKGVEMSGVKETISKNPALTEEGKQYALKQSLDSIMDENGQPIDPSEVQIKNVDIYAPGYGKYLDENYAVTEAFKDADFAEETKTFTESSDKVTLLSNGVMMIKGKKTTAKHAPFFKTSADGEITLKTNEELVDGGYVGRLMQNPELQRIIDDRVLGDGQEYETEQELNLARAQELRKTFQAQAGASEISITDENKVMQQRVAAKTVINNSGSKEEILDNMSNQWVEELLSGDNAKMLNAIGYLRNREWDGKLVSKATLLDGQGARKVIRLTLRDTKGSTVDAPSGENERENNPNYDSSDPEGMKAAGIPQYIRVAKTKRSLEKGNESTVDLDITDETNLNALKAKYGEIFKSTGVNYKPYKTKTKSLGERIGAVDYTKPNQ